MGFPKNGYEKIEGGLSALFVLSAIVGRFFRRKNWPTTRNGSGWLPSGSAPPLDYITLSGKITLANLNLSATLGYSRLIHDKEGRVFLGALLVTGVSLVRICCSMFVLFLVLLLLLLVLSHCLSLNLLFFESIPYKIFYYRPFIVY